MKKPTNCSSLLLALLFVATHAVTPATAQHSSSPELVLARRTHEVGAKLFEAGDREGALRLFAREDSLLRAVGEAGALPLADCLELLAVCRMESRPESALVDLRAAYQLRRRFSRRTLPGTATRNLLVTGSVWRVLGSSQHIDSERVAACLDSALFFGRAARRSLGTRVADAELVADVHRELGETWLSALRPDSAQASFARALRWEQRAHARGPHRHVVRAREAMARALEEQGEFAEALRQREIAASTLRQVVGPQDDAQLVQLLDASARLLDALADHEGAIRRRVEAIRIAERLVPEGDGALAALLQNQAASFLESRSLGEGLIAASRARDLWGRLGNPATPERVSLYALLGRLYFGRALAREGADPARDSDVDSAAAAFDSACALQGKMDHDAVTTERAALEQEFGRSLAGLDDRRDLALPHLESAARSFRVLARDGGRESATALAGALVDLASCQQDLWLQDAAESSYVEVLELLSAPATREDSSHLATALDDYGDHLAATGDYAQSISRREQALEISLRTDADAPETIARAYDNVGFSWRKLGQPERALQYHRQAIQIRSNPTSGTLPLDLARGWVNYGRCLSELGDPDSNKAAVRILRNALAIRLANAGSRPRPGVAKVLDYLGDCWMRAGQVDSALAMYSEGLEIRRAFYRNGNHPEVGRSLTHVADGLARLGRNDEAVERYREALRLLRGEPDRFLTATRLAQVEERNDSLDLAAQHYELAIHALEDRRDRLVGIDEFERARYFHSVHSGDAYVGMFRVLAATGRVEEAVGELEKGRARAVLDLFASGQSDRVFEARRLAEASTDFEFVAHLDGVVGDLTRVEKSVALLGNRRRRSEGAARDSLELALREAEAQLHSLTRKREELIAKYGAAGIGVPRDASGLRTLLGENDCMLIYALGRDRSFVAVLTSNERTRVLELRAGDGRPMGEAELNALVMSYRRRLARVGEDWEPASRGVIRVHGAPGASGASGGSTENAEAGYQLRRFLVPDSLWQQLRSRRRVDVIPHGALYELPFEALVVDSVVSGRSIRYWLDDGPPIAYAPSGSVLAQCQSRYQQLRARARLVDLQALLLGDPEFSGDFDHGAPASRGPGDDLGLMRLPGTRAEVDSIRRVFEATEPPTREGRSRVRVLLGAEATYAQLFAEAPRARFLHLATHGLTDSEDPRLFSRLALAVPAADSVSSMLRLRDVLESWRGRLNSCELVVLSACDTGRGAMDRDEGVLALPVGFFVAGASAVVASEWPVHDERTAQLMSAFYRHVLTGGGDRLSALRDAKRELRAVAPSPADWAPFLYLGASN